MAEIINLRRARKHRARAASQKLAAENRARYGAPKQDTDLETARRALADRRLEDHRRENGGDADS